jgi:hypothetical protein
MTEERHYHYVTYTIGQFHRVSYDPSTEEVEIDALTPKQQKEIARRINAAIERSMWNVLTGGYDVPFNRAYAKGTTYEHVRGPRALLPDSRRGPCEGGAGTDQPCASERETENPSEG